MRIEAKGDSEEAVRASLHGTCMAIGLGGPNWEEEEPGLQIQTAKSGYWGRVTMRRKNNEISAEREN